MGRDRRRGGRHESARGQRIGGRSFLSARHSSRRGALHHRGARLDAREHDGRTDAAHPPRARRQSSGARIRHHVGAYRRCAHGRSARSVDDGGGRRARALACSARPIRRGRFHRVATHARSRGSWRARRTFESPSRSSARTFSRACSSARTFSRACSTASSRRTSPPRLSWGSSFQPSLFSRAGSPQDGRLGWTRSRGDRQMAEILGLDVSTVARGRRELLEHDVNVERVRKAGAGRKAVEKKRQKSSRRSKNL